MFYSAFVCLLITRRENYRLDHHVKFARDVSLDTEVTIKFFHQMWDFLKDFLACIQ